jgi:hypothetical protein
MTHCALCKSLEKVDRTLRETPSISDVCQVSTIKFGKVANDCVVIVHAISSLLRVRD